MIVLGRIVAPFGVKGWVKIHPFGDDPDSWGDMPQWWLSEDDKAPADAWQAVTLSAMKPHGAGWIAAFAGITDRNGAEALIGRFIAAPREALPETAADEHYWADLIGLAVRNKADEALGTVTGLLSTGAHDVLQVRDGDSERLIPFVATYVLEVDQAARSVRVDWEKDW